MSEDLPEDLTKPAPPPGRMINRVFAPIGLLLALACFAMLAYAIWWMP